MEDFCKGAMWGLVAGMVAGSIIIAKNKKYAEKIRKGLGIAEEKLQEAKEFTEEKIEEIKADSFNNNCQENQLGKDFAKKSKNY